MLLFSALEGKRGEVTCISVSKDWAKKVGGVHRALGNQLIQNEVRSPSDEKTSEEMRGWEGGASVEIAFSM